MASILTPRAIANEDNRIGRIRNVCLPGSYEQLPPDLFGCAMESQSQLSCVNMPGPMYE